MVINIFENYDYHLGSKGINVTMWVKTLIIILLFLEKKVIFFGGVLFFVNSDVCEVIKLTMY